MFFVYKFFHLFRFSRIPRNNLANKKDVVIRARNLFHKIPGAKLRQHRPQSPPAQATGGKWRGEAY